MTDGDGGSAPPGPHRGGAEDLNDEQRDVVGCADSAVMVRAGPGSGKTLVIVERVKRLVGGGTDQSAVLCLTFTEKAAGEMRQRLEENGIADVRAETFHSFAKSILVDNHVESGFGASTRIFERHLQMAWCIQNTDSFGLDPEHVRIGNNSARVYGDMLELINGCKNEGISPERLRGHVDERLGPGPAPGAPPQPPSPPSPPSPPPPPGDAPGNLRRLREFCKVYTAYEEYRKSLHMIDFGDMVREALDLLRRNSQLLERYQSAYAHILVDELQDNNRPQFELVKLLAADGGANVMVVGDEDQSIMRFQGAYSEIFADFASSFPSSRTAALPRNYRSTRKIADLANLLMRDVPDRDEDTVSERDGGDNIRVVRTATEDGQIQYMADAIRDMVCGGAAVAGRDGPVRYRDIAILSRRNEDCQRFTRELNSMGVPATFVGPSRVFASQVIRDMVAYLRVAVSPTTSGQEIFLLMHRRGIHERNIRVLMDAARSAEWRSDQPHQDHVFETLQGASGLPVTQGPEIAELAGQLGDMIGLARRATTGGLVHEIMMGHSGLYRKAMQEGEMKDMNLLNKLHEVADEYDDLFPDRPLSAFLEYVSVLGDIEMDVEDAAPPDTVNVLTVHKSKGKQFPVVFVTDLVADRFPTKYRPKPFEIPAALLDGGGDGGGDPGQSHQDEERRLFYVAITRTMDRLYLMCPRQYADNKRPKKPSRFLADLDYESNPAIDVVDFEESDPPPVRPAGPTGRRQSEIQEQAVMAVNRLDLRTAVSKIAELCRARHFEEHGSLDGFDPRRELDVDPGDLGPFDGGPQEPQLQPASPDLTLSATSIRTYQECPLQFKYDRILKVPKPRSQALALGDAVHRTIEQLAKAPGGSPDEAQALDELQSRWTPHDYGTRTGSEASLARARAMVSRYVDWAHGSDNEAVDIEAKFRVKIGGIVFRGKIDRLEKNGSGQYEIIDFKTGKTKETKRDIHTNLQLNIYAMGVEELKHQLPAKASLLYLEDGSSIDYAVTRGSVDEAAGLIEGMVKRIRAGEFEPTPSKRACRFCSYNRICDARYES